MGTNKRVNRIRFDKLLMEWKGKLGAVYAFKGIKDYEEWAMGLATPQQPLDDTIIRLATSEEISEFMSPEGFRDAFGSSRPMTEKEILFQQAVSIREQIENAIAEENYEKADILQKTLDVIELKYNKL